MPAQSKLASKAKASQDFLPIEEIRDSVVVLKDGSLRAVLMTSALNFALKSSEEQEAIIAQYQNFLNEVDFTVQFFVQSRRLNIEPYLDTLRERKKAETNNLLNIQIAEYINFVHDFVETSNIVSKAFYIVVSFNPTNIQLPSSSGGLGGIIDSILGKKGENKVLIEEEKFQGLKLQLWQRVNTVSQGLSRTGVRTVPLNTEELIELYFSLYNPGESDKGKVPEMQKEQGPQTGQ